MMVFRRKSQRQKKVLAGAVGIGALLGGAALWLRCRSRRTEAAPPRVDERRPLAPEATEEPAPLADDDLAALTDDQLHALNEPELAGTLQLLDDERKRTAARLERVQRSIDRLGAELAARGHGG